MRTNFINIQQQKKSAILILIVIVLSLGISLRFVNIDKKAYWGDEAFTSLRISGYTEYQLVEKLASVDRTTVQDLTKYQSVNPENNFIDTIKSLAIEDPQHPPIYYIFTWFWVKLFGNSITAFRTVSAIFSLLALPSVYWLCRELFSSPLTAWLGVGLIAISPFHILYAQEARQYSLWTATILLSSASLLAAIRLNTKFSWGVYAANLALSLYTFPSSVMVSVAHGIYVITLDNFKFNKRTLAYLLSSLAGFIAFLPWLLVIISSLKHINRIVGGQGKMPALSLIKTWAFNLSRIFIDTNHERAVINFGFENSYTLLFQITLVALLVILSAYSLYYLCRRTEKTTWLFILTLILVTSLPIMLKDLLDGGVRSIVLRYLTPGYLGIQLSITHLLARKITIRFNQREFWKMIICVLFSGAIFSGVISSQANFWWTKSDSELNFRAAKFINQSPRPLVISDGSMGIILALSHQLNPQVQLQLKPYCHTCRVIPPVGERKNILDIPNGFDSFLFIPSSDLMQEVKKDGKYTIEPVSLELWRIKKIKN
ncbi:MAG TPA: glycosyltransferase family 39 protein [Nostocaceae cyanobacterium]|nr:glycosyltransferase family 39 protein [Nostocaceae cyanobacterium]